MFSVSFREGLVLLLVLAALILGAAVKHWRDAHREWPAPALVGPAALPETPRH